MSWDLVEGAGQGAWPPFFTPADVRDAERIEAAFVALAATVDPADPWRHPDATALDSTSFAAWLRSQGARPVVLRLHELSALGLAGGSSGRLSMLAQLRLVSAAGASGLSDGEGVVSSTWSQAGDALSMLVAPERLAHFLAASSERRRALAGVARATR